MPSTQSNGDPVTLHSTPRHFLEDQEAIWTSPARIRESNALGPVVLVLATTVAIATDHQVMSSSRLIDPSLNSHASTASNGLLGGFVAAPALIYGIGFLHHDAHATETGILGGEAMADSLVVDEVIKLVSLRERPTLDNARGKFFQTSVGTDSSFPSTHTMIAWSSAAVLASEYNGPLTPDNRLRPRHGGKRNSRLSSPALPIRCPGGKRRGLDDRPVCRPSPPPRRLIRRQQFAAEFLLLVRCRRSPTNLTAVGKRLHRSE